MRVGRKLFIKFSSIQELKNEVEALAKLKEDWKSEFKYPKLMRYGPILISSYVGQSLGKTISLDPNIGWILLSDLIDTLKALMNTTCRDVPWQKYCQDHRNNPWSISQKNLRLIGDNQPIHFPSSVRVWNEHGDLHMENILVLNNEIYLIDSLWGEYPLCGCLIKLVSQFVLIHGSHQTSFILLDIVNEVAEEMDVKEEWKTLLKVRLKTFLYPQLIQKRFRHFLTSSKNHHIKEVLIYLENL